MLTISSLLCASATGDLSATTFDHWKSKHAKIYSSAAEHALRFANFKATAARIAASEAADASTTLGFSQSLNSLSDLDATELAALRGYAWSATAPVSNLPPMTAAASAGDVPAALDWRTSNAVSSVKAQGQGSSCWSFSSAGAIEGAYALAHKTQAVSVSNQQIMDCSGVDCLDAVNGTMTKAFQNIMNWGGGVDADESYPYRDRACVSWDARCDPSMIDPRCKFWCPPHGEIYTQQPRSPLSGDQ